MNADSADAKNKSKDDSKKSKPAPKKLDLKNLDLSVEKVEERISPSETNVFDK
ncbi:MAG: hypothetical protein ACJAZ8_001649 [Planctomycetota bacterium]|jgi:hypothetical protein